MDRILVQLFGTLVLLALTSAASAADSSRTSITLKELDCPSCAKRLAGKLLQVPGVAEVKTDVAAKKVVITPRPQQLPSPRVLWETTEKAGFEPARLEGPAGTFTNRPR